MELTKSVAKAMLKGSFVPKNVFHGRLDEMVFRKTTEDEVYRCTGRVGFDPQSGPLYCGNIADYIAFTEIDGKKYFAVMCESCRMERANFVKVQD